MNEISYVNTATELREQLISENWDTVTLHPGENVLAIICPLCGALVGPDTAGGRPRRWAHIDWHWAVMARLEGVATS